MEWQNAKIESANISVEHHGVFAFGLTFSGPGWGQGMGMYPLNAHNLGMLELIVRKFGSWNDLPGTMVRVGREGDDYGPIVAMRDILDDEKEVRFQ